MKRKHLHAAWVLLLLAGCTATTPEGSMYFAADEAKMEMAVAPRAPAPSSRAKSSTANKAMGGQIMADSAAVVENIMAPQDRQMIFTADYYITVPDVNAAQGKVKQLTEKLGGYVQSISDFNMVVRIPVKVANDALAAIPGIGTVNSRNITGNDVTEEMTDINIRLENLQKMRARLLELSQKDDRVEQLLQVERELNRVTTEIELIQGRLKLLTNQVDYVTISIGFNVEQPIGIIHRNIPVTWVARLTSGIGMELPFGGKKLAFDVDLPDGFAIIYYNKATPESYAISANEAVIKLSRQKDLKNATMKFWQELIERSLAESGLTVTIQEEIKTDEGFTGFIVGGEKSINSYAYGYQVMVLRYCMKVYIYEYWAPLEVFNAQREAVLSSCKTADLSIWRW